ncbi:MAG TPA: ABC transporter permease [Flavitalea sp.]|nr:ABC transporter permease [Flavitalea sp.]
MFKNYFKTAWRNLVRHKTLAFINVFGLSIGITCFILLALYAVNELSFDRFNKNVENIYCVYDYARGADGNPQYTSITAMPLAPTMKKDMPDVIDFVRLKQMPDEAAMRSNADIRNVKITFTDPQFFSIFTFPLKFGNASTALRELNSLVITSSKAVELFGTDDVIGKIVELKAPKDFLPFVITAIAEDIPANSSIHFDVMGSFAFLESTRFGAMFNNWFTTSFRTFVQLRPGSSLPDDVNRLKTFHHTYNPDATTKDGKSVATYGLLPLRSVHTDTRINDISGTEPVEKKTIWIILLIAVSILLIACVNFTTLAIGRSVGRSKEVGIRKVIGASRKLLIFQFLSEAFLLSVLSMIFGLLLAKILLPYFDHLSRRNLELSFSLYPELIWLILGVILMATIFCGSYPALLLSKFEPIEVLKSKIRLAGSNLFTNSLVTLQFTLSVALIISTIVIMQQTRYMTGKNPGFNKENVISVDAQQTDANKNYPLFKQALLSDASVIGVASAGTSFGVGAEFRDHGFIHNNIRKRIYECFADHDYLNVLGMQLVAGRNFNPSIADDTTTSVIINEAMMNEFGWNLSNVIGQQIKGYTNTKTPVVIGVVNNFNFHPLTENIKPQLFTKFAGQRPKKYLVRIKPGDPSHAINVMEKTWKSFASDVPFKYSFLDEDLEKLYVSEKRWSNIVGWSGGISILLACLGLFGLTLLTTVNRVKEIGIRKVMGASVGSIVALLSNEFLRLIIIALLIASPVAWYFMNQWLQSFAYRINVGWQIFCIAGFSVFAVALLTVSFQAIKAAMANPVKSLRAE